MDKTFLTSMEIKSVRHLRDISIPLSSESRKHLILTGKNGCGKTSTIKALAEHLKYIVSDQYDTAEEIERMYLYCQKQAQKPVNTEQDRFQRQKDEKNMEMYARKLLNWKTSVITQCTSFFDLREKYEQGLFVLACYDDARKFNVETYQNIEKIQLKSRYGISEQPGQKLTKYMVDLKAVQAFAGQKDTQSEKIKKIDSWFQRFEKILRRIFDDPELVLDFDPESFQFSIHVKGREPFDFNTLSSGYAAVLEIINDLIMRMEAQSKIRSSFDLEGIVLIDEIETHLHLELQRKILPVLTELFPNIQFIVSTHSPFILNSLENVVIYDLEKRLLVENGMSNLPYEGIVEGYFDSDRLSDDLREKFERYRMLVAKDNLCDMEYAEIEKLEYYLDEIPDYLAKDITNEYSRLKLEFSNRE